MRLHPPTIGPPLGDDEPGGNGPRPPPALCRDLPSEAPLSIQCADQLLDIHDFGLELDDQDRARCRVPGQDVDRATLAKPRERDLGGRHPRGKADKSLGDELMERAVARIQQAVEVSTLPAENEVKPRVEGVRDRTKRG